MIENLKLTLHKKIAVILFQLGGPDSLEAVEPFLFNLFSDPCIISFPGSFLVRKPLAKLISKRCSRKSAEKYKLIGRKSPILDLTQQQASALESMLRSWDINAEVFIAMRYWNPLIETSVRKIKAGGFEQAVLLPLYPQFSQATTLSSINEWTRQTELQGCVIPSKLICCYPSQPLLIEAFVANINFALNRFNKAASADIDLLFSAHGVPISYIKHGDPYQLQVEETVRSIIKRGNWSSPHALCYQSKVGPMKWLQPSLKESIKHLINMGRKNLLIIPVTFVSDHVETMYEINIEAKKYALTNGIRQFEMMPALNSHPKFIQCLGELVQTRLASDMQPDTCEILLNSNKNRITPKMCPWMK